MYVIITSNGQPGLTVLFTKITISTDLISLFNTLFFLNMAAKSLLEGVQ